jgi:PAS domain S-box-containing protein
MKAMLLPYGHAPSDMGGCSGLALQVARKLAAQMDGHLAFVPTPDSTGMQIVLRLPFRVCNEGDDVTCTSTSPGGGGGGGGGGDASYDEEQQQELPASIIPAVPPVDTLTERMFEFLVNNSDDAFMICAVEPDMLRITYVSPNVAHRLCYTHDEIMDHDLAEFCHPDDRQRVGEEVAAAIAGSHNLLSQHRNLTKTGEIVWCETAGWTDTQSFYLVCRDVRHRKKSELELRSFAVSTSADLREPCNGILIITALLEQRPGLSTEAQTLLAVIRASCGLLLGIVTNVLTAKLVESGELALHDMIFDPQAAISDIVQVCRLGCGVNADGDYGISWKSGELPSLVEGDRDRCIPSLYRLHCDETDPVSFSSAFFRLPRTS